MAIYPVHNYVAAKLLVDHRPERAEFPKAPIGSKAVTADADLPHQGVELQL